MIDVVVVHSQPYAFIEEIITAMFYDLAHQVPVAAYGCGGHCRQASQAQDCFHIHNCGSGRVLDGVGGRVASFPLCWQVWLVVELEIAHAHGQIIFDVVDVFRLQHRVADIARVGAMAIDAHDRHNACFQQHFGKSKTALMQHLDPLDAHALQLRQPFLTQLA